MSASGTSIGGDRSAYEPLLRKAEVLYERYEAGRKEPFNLFSVLRKASDEEHLHSKFLETLLNSKSPQDGVMENLSDFVQRVVAPAVDTTRKEAEREEAERRADGEEPHPPLEEAVPPPALPAEGQEPLQADVGSGDAPQAGSLSTGKFSFSLEGARVERERHHIDLLVTNANGQAIVIENKIWAGDQGRQLERYFNTVKGLGLEPTLVYLTLDGHPPTKQSRGEHVVACLSYREDLIPWLRRCQERACDEPALRESLAQYLALIRTLCGDAGREFMTELTNFLREGNNLVLARRLGDAAAALWLDLLFDYWDAVRQKVELEIGARDPKNLRSELDSFVYRRKGHFHYAWHLGKGSDAHLALEARRDEGIFYGVITDREKHGDEYGRLKDKLASLGYAEAERWWSGRKFVYRTSVNRPVNRPSEEAKAVLDDSQKRSEIVRDLIETWESLRRP